MSPQRSLRTVGARGRILVVQPEAGSAPDVRALLLDVGFEVTTAPSLEDALRELAAVRHEALMVDLEVADRDGLRRLGAAAPRTPIIVLASIEDERRALWAVQHGATDYLTRGQLDAPIVLRTLRCATETQRAQSKLASLATELRDRERAMADLSSRTEMISQASIDLDARLQTAHGLLDRLLSEDASKLDERQRDTLQAVQSSLTLALALVAQMLDGG